MKTTSRNYRKEYVDYHIQPKQIKERAARNKARLSALKKGKVKKGSAYDVHHKDKNPRNNNSKNITVVHRKVNRGKLRRKK